MQSVSEWRYEELGTTTAKGEIVVTFEKEDNSIEGLFKIEFEFKIKFSSGFRSGKTVALDNGKSRLTRS